MKKHTKENPNIFRLLLFSYLIVYCIPALIGVVWAVFSYHRISANAGQYQMLMLQQVRYSCDNVLEQMQESAALIATDPSVMALHAKSGLSAQDQFYNKNLKDSLLHQRTAHDSYQECGVLFLRSGSIVTDKRRLGTSLDSAWFAKYGCTIDEFLQRSSGLEGLFVLSQETDDYLFVYRNVYNTAHERTAVSFVVSPVKNMRMILADFDPDHRFEVYLSDGKDLRTSLPGELTVTGRSLEETLPSQLSGWFYGIRTPRAVFYHDIDLAFTLLIVGLLLLLAAGIVAIRHFVSSSYRPLEKIGVLLNSRLAHDTEDASEAQPVHDRITYQGLTDSLESLLSDFRSQEYQIQHHEEARQQELLAGFLRGSCPYPAWLEDFVAENRQLCNLDSFQVVLFTFEDLENCPLLASGKDHPEQSYSLLMFIIRTIVHEVLLQNPEGGENGIILDMGGSIAGIIGCDDTPEEFRYKLISCVETLESAIRIRSLCTVSAAHTNWEELSVAYDEALMTSGTNQYLSGTWKQVLFYSDTTARSSAENPEEPGLPDSPQTSQLVLLERKLINAVSTGDGAGARETLTQICGGFVRDIKYRDYNRSLSILLLHLINDAAGEITTAELPDRKTDASLEESERSLLAASSLQEMESLLLDYLRRTVPERELSEEAVPEWVDRMKAYIEENYADQNLNVSYLTEHFSLSSTHTGSQFRLYTGMSILNYIHQIRIRAAKAALDRSATLKEAAQEAGFSDVKTFIRIFKQYEGITPGQYKEQAVREAPLRETVT